MTAQEMRNAYITLHPEASQIDFDVWAFGDAPDELASLTRSGTKRATSSALPLYALEGETVPQAGGYSIILNSRGEAVCIIRTSKVTIVPFCQVTASFAAKEGEGDRSLSHWRKVHERFFTNAMANAGLAFIQDMPVVCEEFEVVYK